MVFWQSQRLPNCIGMPASEMTVIEAADNSCASVGIAVSLNGSGATRDGDLVAEISLKEG